MRARLPARVDLALFVFAVAIGVPHLRFPLGREHALAAYVARAWLFDGTRPYEGSFSQDPPGLLLVHALAALFGDTSAVPFRLLCLAAVLVVGLTAPLVLVRPGSPVPAGVRGLTACAASLFAHGYFDFWDSGRGGVFVAACLTSSAALLFHASRASHGSRELRRLLGAGALLGAALLLRPSAIPFAPLFLGAAVSAGTTRAHAARRAGTLALGAGLALGAAVLVFARGHVLADAYDLLWDARCTYLGEPSSGALAPFFTMAATLSRFEPLTSPLAFLFSAFAVWALVCGRREDFGRRVFVGGVTLASLIAILLERTYFPFSFELLAAPVALAVAAIALDLAALFPSAPARAHAVLLVQCIFLYAVSCWELDTPPAVYGLRWAALYQHVLGRLDTRTYAATFDVPGIGFFPAENAEVAEWVRARSSERDEILVRGHEPEVYVTARRRYRGRFFSTGQLVWENCAYKRALWLAQDRADYVGHRPRYVVAIDATPGLDSPDPFLPLGYVERLRTPHYVVLEHE